ncbi:hypothetical protein JCM3770_000648 [Rhodotorula araucariae]
MPLKLLQHKSWHVYSAENVARVQRDEARAAAQDAEDDERARLADAEARLDRMRKRVEGGSGRKRRRESDDEGERALARQLKGKGREEERDEREEDDVRAVIVKPEGRDAKVKGKVKEKDVPMTTNGHLNFWAELEDGGQPGSSKLESRLKKVLAAEPEDSATKVYLAKKGEGEPVGWYASQDGKTERERKETVETTLERTYRDNESKRFSDPLALMKSYLQRRDDVLSGAAARALPRPRSRAVSSAAPWDDTPRSTALATPFEPVLPSLLPRKHDRRPPRRSPSPPPPPPPPRRPAAASAHVDPATEAAKRVGSERARAAALLAARRKAALLSASTPASSTPARESDAGGWGVYNREAVEAAREARRGGGGVGGAREGRGGAGGWAERRERREERERGGGRSGWGRR